MKCYNCKRSIPDNSIFCNWCGKYQLDEKEKSDEVTVPEPKQLPSGAWRIQLRREGESVTADTYEACRAEAVKVRRKWLQYQEDHPQPEKFLSLGDAIDAYISSKDNILSPSTIRSYKKYRKYRLQPCMSWNIYDPDNKWQSAVNNEAKDVSAKTVFNAWHLCTAAMNANGVSAPAVSLPRKIKADRKWLDYDQINVFLKAVHGKPCELGALLALHSLRLSELLAITPADVLLDKKLLLVRGSRVLNSDGELVYKELNKTDSSRREVPIVIPRLSDLLKQVDQQADFICDMHRKKLYDQINSVCRKAGLPEVGVHGLRHSFASLAYHLGWKELSTMQVGGWSNSQVVHEIYTHNADLEADIKSMRKHYKMK